MIGQSDPTVCPLCQRPARRGTVWTHPDLGTVHVSCVARVTADAHRPEEAEARLVAALGSAWGAVPLMHAGCTTGYVPALAETPGAYAPGTLDARVRASWAGHGEAVQRFHEAYYRSSHTWTTSSFLGVPVMKAPTDLWAYQELIASLRPARIIETGTWTGGAALWFAVLLDLLGIDGQVVTVDAEDRRIGTHPRIRFVHGDPTDVEVAADALGHLVGPVLVSLAGDCLEDATYAALDLYAPSADALVVERTNVSWGDIPTLAGDRGARGGAERYLTEHPGEWAQDPVCERHLLTLNPGGWWRRVGRPA